MKIKVLQIETVNKIAAGEVIERPASVVKELVENSLDAGATEIDIEVSAGGKSLIRVTDNGVGMEKEDALLSFSRHATSKIDSAEDLFSINTLGFRGEALPSIASVSMLEMVTKAEGSPSATKICYEGGNLISVKETGAPCGTMVTIKNLFFNTPARRKFLKTNTTEITHIINNIASYALVRDDCGFKLSHNGENLIEIFPKDAIFDRIGVLFGNDVKEDLVEINYSESGIIIKGFCALPNINKPNRSTQMIFVNKRPVIHRGLNFAISSAYETLMPNGRFPVVFIFIDVLPDTIDVNVHPTKKEIKFSDDRIIQSAVITAIKSGLDKRHKTVSSKFIAREGGGEAFHYVAEGFTPRTQEFSSKDFSFNNTRAMQAHSAYIVAETEEGLEIYDQHALHERILYEKILSSLAKGNAEGQRLLIPVNVDLTALEKETLDENMDLFKELGFNIEDFGDRTIVIDTIPSLMENADIPAFIKDSLSEIKNLEKSAARKGVKDGIIKTMACRSAIKRGDSVNGEEIQRLLHEWKSLKLPYSCPHGRTAMVSLTKEELDKRYNR